MSCHLRLARCLSSCLALASVTLAVGAIGDSPVTLAADTTPAVAVTAIAPASASYGESVTISGNGFGGPNVVIRVGGVRAFVVSATGAKATFRVPTGVPVGVTSVTATNPGGRSGSIGFDLNGHVSLALDEANRAQQFVGAAGGVLTTTSGGRTYTLTIPPGALVEGEAIVMTPVAGMAGLPLDTFLGAVHFSPEGLQFGKPAILEIHLPSTANTHGLATFSAAGNGENLHLVPFTVADNGTILLTVTHFSVAGGGTGTPAATGAIGCTDATLECTYLNRIAQAQQQAVNSVCGSDCLTPTDLGQHTTAISQAQLAALTTLLGQWFTDAQNLLNTVGTTSDDGLNIAGHEYEAWRGWLNSAALVCYGFATCADIPSLAADVIVGDDALGDGYRLSFDRAHAACNDRRVSDLMVEALQLALLGKGGLPATQQELQATFACQMIIQASLPPTAHPGDSIPFSVQVLVQLGANPPFTLPAFNADVTIRVVSGCATIGSPGSTAKTLTQTADVQANVSTQIQIPTNCVSSSGVSQVTVLPQNATVALGGSIVYTVQVQGGGVVQVVVSVADYIEPSIAAFALGRSETYNSSVEGRATWTASGGTITPGPATTATYTAGATVGIFGVTATSVDDPSQSQTVAVTVGNPNPPPPPPPPPPPTVPFSGVLSFTHDTSAPNVPTHTAVTAAVTADVVGGYLFMRTAAGTAQDLDLSDPCGADGFTGTVYGVFQIPTGDPLPIFPNTERVMSFFFLASGTDTSHSGTPETGCETFANAVDGGFSKPRFFVTNIVRDPTTGEIVEVDFDKTFSEPGQTATWTGRLVR